MTDRDNIKRLLAMAIESAVDAALGEVTRQDGWLGPRSGASAWSGTKARNAGLSAPTENVTTILGWFDQLLRMVAEQSDMIEHIQPVVAAAESIRRGVHGGGYAIDSRLGVEDRRLFDELNKAVDEYFRPSPGGSHG